MSRAILRRNGPRSGLSSEVSERTGFVGVGVSGFFFLDRDGDGEGGFLGRGDGVFMMFVDSDLWVGVSGIEIRGGWASGGVFTRPGMVVVGDETEKRGKLCLCLCV